MQSLSDDERKSVLGEVFADELKVILEYVKDIPEIKQRVMKVEDIVTEHTSDFKVVKAVLTDLQQTYKSLATKADLARVEAKVDTIKAAVTDTNRDMTQLDNRLTLVEQAL